MTVNAPILEVQNLRKLYPAGRGLLDTLLRRPQRNVHALDDVSFAVQPGEILGLVGESGSGKTTTAMCIMGLVPPSTGHVLFNGEDLGALMRGRGRMAARRQIQMIFQDPYEALNPRQTVFQSVAEPLEVHRITGSYEEKRGRAIKALDEAGLKPAEQFLDRYPEALSGGQRQRVVIAGSLVLNPQVLVADEPVSMLDVSIRAEILNLLRELRDRHGITIVYITHDLATAGFFTDRIAVMYLGRIVEIGPTAQVLSAPRHPYTKALLSVIPVPNPRHRRKRQVLSGEIASAVDLPPGCRFHPRCPEAVDRCRRVGPLLAPAAAAHQAACILANPEAEE